MKKFLALVLAVVLMSTIAATCFAAGHTHSYRITYGTIYYPDGHHEVAGCHNCPYRHTHTYSRTQTYISYTCSCGAGRTDYSSITNGPDYCPYSH